MPHPAQRKLRIGIDAALGAGRGTGGVESVVRALVSALAKLDDGPEEYVLLTSPESPNWLDDVSGDNQRVVTLPRPAPTQRRFPAAHAFISRQLRRFDPPPAAPALPQVPLSDGFIESLRCDVMHFPSQDLTLCATPFIYHPHDLQHRHFPEFFSAFELARRDALYRAGCNFARAIAVASGWVAHDLERELGVHPDKVQVIPLAAPTQAVAAMDPAARAQILHEHGISRPFALYPAKLWPHKNHERLLEAVALLRARDGMTLRLVCTGARGDARWSSLQGELDRLDLRASVTFVGELDGRCVRALYAESSFVVVPTLFEAASAPIFEAWLEGKPVACSRVTSLPEQAGSAALLFDPQSVDDLAEALKRMMTDAALRDALAAAGKRRLRDFDWDRTARTFRALYRRVGRVPLSPEEQRLLSWNWMRESSPNEQSVATESTNA